MTKQEQLLIKSILEDLKKSTKTSWTSGGLTEWSEYANIMKATIIHSVNILQVILHDEFQNAIETPAFNNSTIDVINSNIKQIQVDKPKEEDKPWN